VEEMEGKIERGREEEVCVTCCTFTCLKRREREAERELELWSLCCLS